MRLWYFPPRPSSSATLVRVRYLNEDYDGGVQLASQMLAEHPSADLYYYLARLHLDTRRESDAAQALEKALELNPNHLGALFHKGTLPVCLYTYC